MIRTNDPVRDAEERGSDPDRDYILCDHCFGKIYKADNLYDGDKYYPVDEKCICEECISDYLQGIRKECA